MSNKLLTLKDLRDLHDILPKECVIAGGCIRDMYFGVAPKDIDIWVPWEINFDPVNRPKDDWDKWLKAGVRENRGVASDQKKYEEGKLELIQNFIWEGYNLQMMTLKQGVDIYEYISGFDAGINMSYFDGYLVYPDEFVRDAVEKKYTLYQVNDKTKERAERFCKKLGLTVDYKSEVGVGDAGWGQPDSEAGARF